MSRAVFLIILVWAVIAAPALCVAGVLEHHCPCEAESTCDHELDCDSDPCAELVFRKDESAPVAPGPALASLLPRTDWMPIRSAPPAQPAPVGRGPVGVPPSVDLPLLN